MGQINPEVEISLLRALESALDELIVDNLIADHVKKMAQAKKQQWKLNFSNMPKKQKLEVQRQLEQKGNVRRYIVPKNLVESTLKIDNGLGAPRE